MKKFLATFLTLVAISVSFADIGPVGRSVTEDGTGTLNAGSVEKFYTNVKNQTGGSLESGRVVVLDVTNDDGYSVTTATAESKERPHCVIAETCTSGKVCLCQTWGIGEVDFDVTNASAVAGQTIFLSQTNAGYVQASSSPSALDYSVGTFYDASAASSSIEAFIRLR